MGIDFTNVLFTVLSLMLLAVPGFLFAKLKMLPEKTVDAFSTIALYGCQTVLVFTSFQEQAFRPDIAINMLIVAGLAFLIHGIMIAIICLTTWGKGKDAKVRCIRYAGLFSNCGFMGFPFLQSLFPKGSPLYGEVMIYAAVIISVFNIVNWTVGVFLMTGDRKRVSLKKILLNPVIIAVIVGLVIFVTVKTPFVDLAPEGSILDNALTKLMTCLGYLSNMITPLSMIIIGIKLANVNFKQLFLDAWVYLSSLYKLIIMSLVSILVVAFLPIQETVKCVIFFLLSMPSATSTAMFAVQFKGDSETGSILVLTSTILSIATIPLMYLLYNAIALL